MSVERASGAAVEPDGWLQRVTRGKKRRMQFFGPLLARLKPEVGRSKQGPCCRHKTSRQQTVVGLTCRLNLAVGPPCQKTGVSVSKYRWPWFVEILLERLVLVKGSAKVCSAMAGRQSRKRRRPSPEAPKGPKPTKTRSAENTHQPRTGAPCC